MTRIYIEQQKLWFYYDESTQCWSHTPDGTNTWTEYTGSHKLMLTTSSSSTGPEKLSLKIDNKQYLLNKESDDTWTLKDSCPDLLPIQASTAAAAEEDKDWTEDTGSNHLPIIWFQKIEKWITWDKANKQWLTATSESNDWQEYVGEEIPLEWNDKENKYLLKKGQETIFEFSAAMEENTFTLSRPSDTITATARPSSQTTGIYQDPVRFQGDYHKLIAATKAAIDILKKYKKLNIDFITNTLQSLTKLHDLLQFPISGEGNDDKIPFTQPFDLFTKHPSFVNIGADLSLLSASPLIEPEDRGSLKPFVEKKAANNISSLIQTLRNYQPNTSELTPPTEMTIRTHGQILLQKLRTKLKPADESLSFWSLPTEIFILHAMQDEFKTLTQVDEASHYFRYAIEQNFLSASLATLLKQHYPALTRPDSRYEKNRARLQRHAYMIRTSYLRYQEKYKDAQSPAKGTEEQKLLTRCIEIVEALSNPKIKSAAITTLLIELVYISSPARAGMVEHTFEHIIFEGINKGSLEHVFQLYLRDECLGDFFSALYDSGTRARSDIKMIGSSNSAMQGISIAQQFMDVPPSLQDNGSTKNMLALLEKKYQEVDKGALHASIDILADFIRQKFLPSRDEGAATKEQFLHQLEDLKNLRTAQLAQVDREVKTLETTIGFMGQLCKIKEDRVTQKKLYDQLKVTLPAEKTGVIASGSPDFRSFEHMDDLQLANRHAQAVRNEVAKILAAYQFIRIMQHKESSPAPQNRSAETLFKTKPVTVLYAELPKHSKLEQETNETLHNQWQQLVETAKKERDKSTLPAPKTALALASSTSKASADQSSNFVRPADGVFFGLFSSDQVRYDQVMALQKLFRAAKLQPNVEQQPDAFTRLTLRKLDNIKKKYPVWTKNQAIVDLFSKVESGIINDTREATKTLPVDVLYLELKKAQPKQSLDQRQFELCLLDAIEYGLLLRVLDQRDQETLKIDLTKITGRKNKPDFREGGLARKFELNNLADYLVVVEQANVLLKMLAAGKVSDSLVSDKVKRMLPFIRTYAAAPADKEKEETYAIERNQAKFSCANDDDLTMQISPESEQSKKLTSRMASSSSLSLTRYLKGTGDKHEILKKIWDRHTNESLTLRALDYLIAIHPGYANGVMSNKTETLVSDIQKNIQGQYTPSQRHFHNAATAGEASIASSSDALSMQQIQQARFYFYLSRALDHGWLSYKEGSNIPTIESIHIAPLDEDSPIVLSKLGLKDPFIQEMTLTAINYILALVSKFNKFEEANKALPSYISKEDFICIQQIDQQMKRQYINIHKYFLDQVNSSKKAQRQSQPQQGNLDASTFYFCLSLALIHGKLQYNEANSRPEITGLHEIAERTLKSETREMWGTLKLSDKSAAKKIETAMNACLATICSYEKFEDGKNQLPSYFIQKDFDRIKQAMDDVTPKEMKKKRLISVLA